MLMKKIIIFISIVCISTYATAQYDSTKTLQVQNSYGFTWKNGSFLGSFWLPQDTLKLKVADSGAVAMKGDTLYRYTGYAWRKITSGGSTITASNGATKVGNDIQVGGLLNSTTNIDGQGLYAFNPTNLSTFSMLTNKSGANVTTTVGSDGTHRLSIQASSSITNNGSRFFADTAYSVMGYYLATFGSLVKSITFYKDSINIFAYRRNCSGAITST